MSNNKRKAVTIPTEGEYKGYKTLTLPLGNDRDFSFGVAKAKAVVKHMDAIKRFVETHGSE